MSNVATINNLKVKKRDFLLFPNKYLKQIGEYDGIVVTNRDVEEYLITKASNVATKSNSVVIEREDVSEGMAYIFNPKLIRSFYGCECEKIQGKILCPKHGRY